MYLLKWDGDISSLKIQKEELEQVAFIPLKKFEQDVKNQKKSKKYVPHKQYYWDIIKEIKHDLS